MKIAISNKIKKVVKDVVKLYVPSNIDGNDVYLTSDVTGPFGSAVANYINYKKR